jgi:hypothetical protein
MSTTIVRASASLRALAIFGGLLAIGPIALWACEDDSTSAAPTTPVLSPTLTTPAPSSNPGADAGSSGDAGGGSGAPPDDTIPDKRTLKLANFGEVPINACIRRATSGDPYTGPLFRAAGVPKNNVSARALIDQIAGNGEVKIIAATDDCNGAELGTITLALSTQSQDSHLGVDFGASAGTGGFFEHLKSTPGKESVMTQDLSSPRYARDDGVGGEVNLRLVTGDAVLLDPDVVGTITLVGSDAERKIKPLAGRALSLWGVGGAILLCDERAAAVDGLTNCSETLRAP